MPGNPSGNNGRQLAIPYDGSKPLKNNTHERYARFRAQALPRMVAFRKAGNIAKNDCNAEANSFRLDKKPGVRERIEYLTGQAQDRIIEKRVALEEQLWSMAEADIGDYFETHEVATTSKDGMSAAPRGATGLVMGCTLSWEYEMKTFGTGICPSENVAKHTAGRPEVPVRVTVQTSI